MTHQLAVVARELAARSVRYVLIGVSGANLYGPAGQAVFTTKDVDLFLPPDADNLVRAWSACENVPLELWLGDEPLDSPRDKWLAGRVIERRALTTAKGTKDLLIDLTLVMKGFEFESVWKERRDFLIELAVTPSAVPSRHWPSLGANCSTRWECAT